METRFIQLHARQKTIDRYKLKTRLGETLLLVLFAIFNFLLFISTLISPPQRQIASENLERDAASWDTDYIQQRN
jgi:hypothetical protein